MARIELPGGFSVDAEAAASAKAWTSLFIYRHRVATIIHPEECVGAANHQAAALSFQHPS
ncbi:hypothetical protein [Sulfuriroseicoccus oceanibius]|uniref:Uncharacterized protein n=1 Tax=Sulfuriroseicoccus oceanibius TaxID=2707525 RepID=A0A6B3LC72_9BACT|nr:hypothetical protein [Sulfuriroseicoccus oceanibius]QQL44560.1 hypothetical protein G3M56_011815 [Sulfuriroseicoccus oceanibius]